MTALLRLVGLSFLVALPACSRAPQNVPAAADARDAEQQLRILSRHLSAADPGSEAARRLLAQIRKIKNREAGQTASHPDVLIEAFARLKTNHRGQQYRPGYRARELERALQRRKGAGSLLPWVERGPGNVSGRVRSLLIDQGDSSGCTWLAASIGGGIWKTADAGVSWRSTTGALLTLSTTSLAQSAADPDVIYAGTGMGFGRIVDLLGSGVWKSADRGETWNQLESTANGELLEAINAGSPLLLPTGARFGAAFDPAEVALNDWGTARFTIEDCAGGSMEYEGPAGFGAGNLGLARLTVLSGLECGLVGSEAPAAKIAPTAVPLAGLSGSWLNPEEPGHGWIIQILESGGVLVVWFVFTPDAEQAWIIASGGPEAMTETGFTLDAGLITGGAAFGPDFDPAAVERIPWGTLSFSFDGCGAGTMSYDSILPGYGHGSHFIERLSNLADSRCDL